MRENNVELFSCLLVPYFPATKRETRSPNYEREEIMAAAAAAAAAAGKVGRE